MENHLRRKVPTFYVFIEELDEETYIQRNINTHPYTHMQTLTTNIQIEARKQGERFNENIFG